MSEKFILEIPSNMEDITLEQYQRYVRATKDLDKENDNSEFLGIKLIEIFCGATYDQIRRLPAPVYDMAVEQILGCLQESTPHIKTFTMVGSDGVEIDFGMVPNLHSMSQGEFMDLDGIYGDWDKMHQAMAVLYRPILKKKKDLYDIEAYETYEKYEELMRHTPLNVAMGALVFFYRLGIKLSKHTLSSMLKDLDEQERSQVEETLLAKSGVGINQFTQLLEETYSGLTKSLNSQSINL